MSCGRSSSVEWKLPKLQRRVRFPSPAPPRPAARRAVLLCLVIASYRARQGEGDKIRPTRAISSIPRDKVRPAQPLQRFLREKTHPARLKTAFFGRFGLAGRTFSRTGRRRVATLKPMTPLQPLMQATVKPPSPLLASGSELLKPPAPLQPKYALKPPISHAQRR